MATSSEDDENILQFHEMGLDDRILLAITKLNWKEPTLIQEKAIPLALQGKDILARARTGSGKTACALIPVIQKLLQIKASASEQKTLVLFLAPSKELCKQALAHFTALTTSCSQEITGFNITKRDLRVVTKKRLMQKPDIVFSTPSQALRHARQGELDLEHLTMVIIDEADLLFSFGYQEQMTNLKTHFPKIYQAFLMSATLDEDVKSLKKLMLHNAVTLKLAESSLPNPSQLTQYYAKFGEKDKFLLLFTLLKMKLLEGKCLIFVRNTHRCYKLKMFLSHVGIRACVLNTELPVNSRLNILQKFNEGHHSIIIAADQAGVSNSELKSQGSAAKKRDKSESSAEYGVSRGIDFQSVANVINFDFPANTNAYIHRVGRTARGRAKGTALSLVNRRELAAFEKVKEEVTAQYVQHEEVFKPFDFPMSEVEGLRYRAREALSHTGKLAVWDTRREEIRAEIRNSEKLQEYFAEHPRDQEVLYDRPRKSRRPHPESLKFIPEYIIPDKLKGRYEQINESLLVREKIKSKKRQKKEAKLMEVKKQRLAQGEDPLDSFSLDAEPATEEKLKGRRYKFTKFTKFNKKTV